MRAGTLLRRLEELTALGSGSLSPEEAIRQSLPLLREGLGASQVYLTYGWENGFRSLGTDQHLGLTDIALWLVQRELMSRGKPCAFDRREGRVVDFRDAGSRGPYQYVAALLPVQTTSDMVIALGPWPRGLGAMRARFLGTVLPALGLLTERWLSTVGAERQRDQLGALANITRVLSESEDLNTVLTSMARTVATVTGISYVSIDILGEDGTIALRTSNGPDRPGVASLTQRWKRGSQKPDPVREAVLHSRQPLLLPDVQRDERVPEQGRNYFIRTLIRSAAVFPLLTRDEVLGILSVASHQPLELTPAEVELLEGLAAQVAAAVKGIQLYQEVAESREDLRRLNEQLQEGMQIQHHLARTDPLTGIPNRRYIDEVVQAECLRAHRYGEGLSVAMADLDGLKSINDTYGHPTGDEALKFLASMARESCRRVDVVGRYGGDEFVFVLPATRLKGAAGFAERFRRRVSTSPLTNCGDEPILITVSVGIAELDEESLQEPWRLIQRADNAMYQAKADGRNRVAVAGDRSVRVA